MAVFLDKVRYLRYALMLRSLLLMIVVFSVCRGHCNARAFAAPGMKAGHTRPAPACIGCGFGDGAGLLVIQRVILKIYSKIK